MELAQCLRDPPGLASPDRYARLAGKENAITHKEFNHLLDAIKALPPEQIQQLRRALDRALVPTGAPAKQEAGETAYDLASRAGLIGYQGRAAFPDRPQH